MHANQLSGEEIDNNLYPALLQVFAIILLGYLAACFEIIDKNQAIGLNKFVSTFALPALLFRNTAVLDFSSVNWYFLFSIFISKSTVFVVAIIITLIILRPINIGLAALFGIFVSQSNDFALGYPILHSIYSKTHPEYLHYIYLIAPISLCILNPIAFFFMELNEVLAKNRQVNREYFGVSKTSDDEHEENIDKTEAVNEVHCKYQAVSTSNLQIQDFDEIITEEPASENFNTSHKITPEIENLFDKNLEQAKNDKDITTVDLLKKTILSTISNPIVFMTMIGLLSSFILHRQIPYYIDSILLPLSNTFSAIALFYLGFTMFGKIRNLSFSTIVVIMVLIFAKSVLYPLITRELVLHLSSGGNMTVEDTESLSTFGFLYGTFPTAPSLFFYITRYKAIGDELVSSALVFGTLASAPLMMISGKMIALNYNDTTALNFEDIDCKTASGFSILTWFCCIWVLYVFIASGRAFLKSHRFIFWLIVSQMLNALTHIIWSSVFRQLSDIDLYSKIHVLFALYFAFSAESWPLAIMINIATSSSQTRNSNKCFEVLLKLGRQNAVYYLIGIVLPLIGTLLCAIVGGIPDNQGLMISLGRLQIIIGNVLLSIVIVGVFICLIVFFRVENENNYMNPVYHKKYELLPDESIIEESEMNFNQRLESDHTYKDIGSLNDSFQIKKQLALVIILTFDSCLIFFFQMWLLFDEAKSGIFFELQLINTTLLFGQGFLTFLVFGFDNEYIFAPILFKIKEMLNIIKPFQPIPLDQVSNETLNLCKKFEDNYKEKCKESIVKNHRFHHKYYRNVFKGSDLVDWLIRKDLASSRDKAVEIGRNLIAGRLIQHVSKNKDFYDGYHLYSFMR